MQGYFDGKKVKFFEMGCRLGGSYFNHEQACLGYNAMTMIIRYAMTGKMVEDINSISKESAKYKKYALDCNYLLKGYDHTVSEIRGMKEVEELPECVAIQKYHEVGYRYGKDRTVDRPIMVAEVVLDSKDEVLRVVNYINDTFEVLDENGESILMDKLDPAELFKKKY